MRLPLALLLLPLLPSCGDSGSDSASATMLTTVSTGASASTGDSSGPAGTTEPSDPPTTSAATTDETTGAHADTTTTTTTTTASDTTSSDTADDTTSTPASTSTAPMTTADDTTSGGGVCGDGILDPGEACDDGTTPDCAGTHDGGDGVCVPADTCSPDYILSGDACVLELIQAHVHVMVSNTCEMVVDPEEFSVQPGQKLKLEYHNHSVDYMIDVWMQYNGGMTDLEPGGTWKETYEHCFGPNPSEGWADISTACSEYVLPIHCL